MLFIENLNLVPIVFLLFIKISLFRTQDDLELHIVRGDCRHGRAKLYSKHQYFNTNHKQDDQGNAKVNKINLDFFSSKLSTIKFSTNIKVYIHKIKTNFFSPCLRHLGAKKRFQYYHKIKTNFLASAFGISVLKKCFSLIIVHLYSRKANFNTIQ